MIPQSLVKDPFSCFHLGTHVLAVLSSTMEEAVMCGDRDVRSPKVLETISVVSDHIQVKSTKRYGEIDCRRPFLHLDFIHD